MNCVITPLSISTQQKQSDKERLENPEDDKSKQRPNDIKPI